MNSNTVHPVELLLLAGMALIWATWTLARAVLVPAVALVLAVTRRPAAPPPPVAPVAVHPLAQLADDLALTMAGSTVAELRSLARSAGLRRLARTGRKAQLIEALVAWEVAMV